MATHTLSASLTVAAPIERVWSFFSDARNLGRITPRSLGFQMHSPASETREGALIEHSVRPVLGIPLRWQTLIESVDAPRSFRDVQVKGPYARWVHEHRFTDVPGGTRMDDLVEYRVPLGPVGELAHRAVVRAQLRHIFDHRASAIADIFEPAGDPSTTHPGTVAVAGGTGFVGGEVARELRRRGRRVVVLSSRGEAARGRLPDDIEIRWADVRTEDGLAAALAGVDELVISLAFPGLPIESPRQGRTFMEVDARGTSRLVAAARAAGVGRVLYVSGAGAGHDATRHWFRAKAIAEDAVRSSGLVWTIVRPTWVYGPDDVSLNRFLGFARLLPVVPMTNLGRQVMAPVSSRDLAVLAADSLEQDVAVGRVFELGGPDTMPMREVLRRALAVAELSKPLVPGPAPLIKAAAWPMRLLPQPPLTADAVDFVNQPAVVDVGPLLAAMPRRLTPLEEGLSRYLAPADSSVRFDAPRETVPTTAPA